MGFTIDIDTGGTFTDGFFVSNGQVEMVKVPTTPHDLTVCFLECVKAGAERFGLPAEDLLYQTDIVRFSNTIGTNAIIQRDGSKLGLLTTSGRENLVPTRSEDNLAPLVAPDMVLGIDEETSRKGKVIKAPDKTAVLSAAQMLIDRGARCLVVALAHSEFNPANENLIRRVIKGEYPRDFLGSVPVYLSADISRRSGDEQRINAAVINAYIHAKLVRLLYKAGEELRRYLYARNLFIVHNNGAVARVAKTRAINTYNSGPAAGLLGASMIGRLYNAEDLISMDMGGTSFDLGYVRQGQASYALNPVVEGLPVNVPMLAIRAIGAGGGSIASVENGRLKVGPQSAGALPGPVCFDLGGVEPTVADADLILGILDPDFFLGGGMKLNLDKARTVMQEKVAAPLGLTVEQAALSVKQTVDEAMGSEVERLKGNFGPDAQPLLMVYGGAGPAHCCDIARKAGLNRIVATPFSAVFSAFSSASMDVGHLYYRRVDLPFGEKVDLSGLAEPLAEMELEARRDMRGEGFTLDDIEPVLDLFIHSPAAGKEIKLSAPVDFHLDPEKIKAAAGEAGTAFNGAKDLILTTVGLMVHAPVPHYRIEDQPAAESGPEQALKNTRPVFLSTEKGTIEAPVYDRTRLRNTHRVEGPAIVESEHTTFLVPDGWRLTVDRYNNALLEVV